MQAVAHGWRGAWPEAASGGNGCFERQRDESARECDRLRAVATWEMSMRKIAEERTDSLRAELDQAKEEIEQLQSRLEGNEEAEHVAATLHELRVALASSHRWLARLRWRRRRRG